MRNKYRKISLKSSDFRVLNANPMRVNRVVTADRFVIFCGLLVFTMSRAYFITEKDASCW
jgi:hypothetical protein